MERRTWAWGIGASLLLLWLVSTGFALRWASNRSTDLGATGVEPLDQDWVALMVRPDLVDPTLPSGAWTQGGLEWNRANAGPMALWLADFVAPQASGRDDDIMQHPRHWTYEADWTAQGASRIHCRDEPSSRCRAVQQVVVWTADASTAFELFETWVGEDDDGMLTEELRHRMDAMGWDVARAWPAPDGEHRVVVFAQQGLQVAGLFPYGFEPDRVPLERVMTLLDASLDGIAARVEEEG